MVMDRMILAQASYRITFAGGGTDLPAFYTHQPGAVVNLTINKYTTILVTKQFSPKILRFAYSNIENVENVDQLKHRSAAQILRMLGIASGIEIHSQGDIPYDVGSGLGSGSTFNVALLQALHAYLSQNTTPEQLARESVDVERQLQVKETGHTWEGKQDHYSAAYGGLNLFEFNTNDTVTVKPIEMTQANKQKLQDHLLLMYLPVQRSEGMKANDILQSQSKGALGNIEVYKQMASYAHETADAMVKGDINRVGAIMNENYKLKKSLDKNISKKEIDDIYELALKNGAMGGKLIGAGGGGFMLFVTPPEETEGLTTILEKRGLRKLPFKPDYHPSRILYSGEPNW